MAIQIRRAERGSSGVGLVMLLGILSIPALLFAVGRESKKTVEAGKTYRFFWKVKPPLGPFTMDAMTAALRSTGAQSITANQGSDETVGSHVQKVLTTKEIDIGKPTLVATGLELTFTGVTEVPS